MDEDVERLVREERLLAAAELAAARGDARTASTLYERACEFRKAAEEALRAGDVARALPLALEAKEPALAERALPALLADAAQSERVAFHLERRGDFTWAGRVLDGIGKRAEAARAFERGGDTGRAATLLEAEGDVVGAARALEGRLRKEPGRTDLQLALGALLLRFGKTDAAARALQRIGEGAPERREALTLLLTALDRLGLGSARLEVERELEALGGPLVREHEPAPGGALKVRLFGRYDVVRDVASSASARVVECHDGVRGERVAVKIFAGHDARGGGRDALARFEREVRALAALEHPNVVPLREYVPEGPALVLAWMGGGTLERMLTTEVLTPARAVEIAQALLGALGEGHRLGIVHRDVKPANVMFDDAGVTRLGDFGVAHLGDLSSTATAGVIGTLGYMSPEQREGRPATVQSDVFSAGAVLWEMLTGRRPDARFGEDAPVIKPSDAHRELGEDHDAIVLAMLATSPEGRPDDAFAARRALGALRWPDTPPLETRAARSERPRSERPASLRLEQTPGGGAIDRWLDRRAVVLPLDAGTLARASAFARAGHPCLQTVLRVDREAATLWLSAPRGARPTAPLDGERAKRLRDALARLHEVGGVHGSVDGDHVRVGDDGDVTLLFPASAPPLAAASADLDRLGLARLS